MSLLSAASKRKLVATDAYWCIPPLVSTLPSIADHQMFITRTNATSDDQHFLQYLHRLLLLQLGRIRSSHVPEFLDFWGNIWLSLVS